MQQNYVLGFLFKEDHSSVVLIKKNKPEWQKGLLNGIGGKIEENETPYSAMIREFMEETGVDTNHLDWRLYCELTGDNFKVYCFTTKSNDALELATSMESEQIVKLDPSKITASSCISNLSWLIPLALDENDGKRFLAKVNY